MAPATALDNDLYVSRFLAREPESAHLPVWLREMKRAAIGRYAELGFPRTSQEEWRFTNVAPIANTAFRAAPAAEQVFTAARLERLAFAAAGEFRMVFVNGRFSPGLSSPVEAAPAGLRFLDLARALEICPDRVRPWLGGQADFSDHAFVALNTAFFEGGPFLEIAAGTAIEQPLHIIHVMEPGSAEPPVAHPRTLIVLGASSQARVVESYGGPAGVYFTNAVTEIVAEENATIDHYKLQNESVGAFHVATTCLTARDDATVVSHSISLGGELVRNDIILRLDGTGAAGTINGLYVVTGSQHVDNHTRIDHARPHGASRELYKGILDGKSRAVFNGRIRVHPDAQKTDSKQTNKNLLLSDEALVNTNPQLEIHADDVKCTHGATIGQLDETALFYLRSRGIGLKAARHILTYAFANDIVERIRIPELRARLDEYLAARLRDEPAPGPERAGRAPEAS